MCLEEPLGEETENKIEKPNYLIKIEKPDISYILPGYAPWSSGD